MCICESIKKRYIRLSKGQRKVAQFVIENPNVIATQTAAEVGRLANVSESTVIRFCYAMELTGYVALQELMKDYLLDKTGTVPISTNNLGKQDKQSCSYIMQRDLKGIQDTMQLVSEENFERCVHALNKAESVHILSKDNSCPAANWLGQTLSQLRSDVHLLSTFVDDLSSPKLAMLNEDAILILFVFNQDLDYFQRFIEFAKVRKAKIVAITDTAFSPLRADVNAIFTIGSSQQSLMDKTPALFSFLHALVSAGMSEQKLQMSH